MAAHWQNPTNPKLSQARAVRGSQMWVMSAIWGILLIDEAWRLGYETILDGVLKGNLGTETRNPNSGECGMQTASGRG